MPAQDPRAPAPQAPSTSTLLLGVVSGSVTDSGDGAPSVGLGGKGTLAATASVRVSQIVSGALKVLGEAAVDANGKFDVKVPLGVDTLIAQALDATGHILGAVIVGASGKASADVVIAAPITTETSLEVAVLLDACGCPMAATGTHAGLALALDVTALVDAKLTASVAAAVKAGADVEVLASALASAVVASAKARVDALVDAGARIDADAAVKADIDALTHLSVGLVDVLAGKADLGQVTAKLLADLDAALAATADVSASVRVRAQVAASLTFCATLAASLVGVAHVDGVIFAATHAAAQIEANLTATAVTNLVALAGGGKALVDAAVAAGNKLIADVGAATSLPVLQQARLDFVSGLVGGVTGSAGNGGLLGDLLTQTTGSVNALLGSVLDSTAKLAADLDANVKANLSAMVKANVCLDVAASAKLDVTLKAVVASLAKFATDVQALGPSLTTGTTGQVTAQAVTDLLSTLQVALRVTG